MSDFTLASYLSMFSCFRISSALYARHLLLVVDPIVGFSCYINVMFKIMFLISKSGMFKMSRVDMSFVTGLVVSDDRGSVFCNVILLLHIRSGGDS